MGKSMAERVEGVVKRAEAGPAKSPPHYEAGIRNIGQLTHGLSLVMADVLAERVGPAIANVVCNASGKMLKAVELQERFGKTQPDTGRKELLLPE